MVPGILDRYIFREFIIAFVAVVAFCALLLLVSSMFDRFADIMENDPPVGIVVKYFLSRLPGQLMQMIPIAAVLAVLFSIGSLARHNEVIAMMTSGIHGLRISVPIVFGGILIVIASFITNEYVVPPLEKANHMLELQLEDKSIVKPFYRQNVFARGRDNWFYMARLYSTRDKVMARPLIVQLSPDQSKIVQRIEANIATLQRRADQEKSSTWMFDKARIWNFNETGTLTSFKAHETSIPLELEEDLAKILAQQERPEEMNFNQLKERIQILSERNQPVVALQTDLLRKVSFPLGTIIIMLIGFAYAVRTRAGIAMTMFGYGICWAFGYYGINALTQALGHSGTISPYLAAVLPLAVFGIISFIYLRRSYRWHS